MFAIVEIAGLQYKVGQDQKLFVNRLKGDVGSKVSFDKVLLTVNGATTIGAQAVSGITVDAEIINHLKADKVIVFKKKRRKGYQKSNGHRQQFSQILIQGILGKGEILKDEITIEKKAAAKPAKPAVETMAEVKAEAPKKAAAKKAPAKKAAAPKKAAAKKTKE